MEANRARGVIVALLTLSLVTVSLLTVWSPSVQAQSPAVDYDIKVEKSVVVIDIRPGQIGMANNTITLTNNGNHSLIIEVRSYCGVFIVLPSIQFVPLRYNQSVTIPISIFAPAERPLEHADCAVEARKVDVYGPTPDPGFRYTDFKAVVLQYTRLSVEADKPFLQIRPDKLIIITFTIHNRGNFTDRASFDIVNAKELEEEGFSITLFTPVLREVDPNTSMPLVISIRTPRGTVIGWSDAFFTLELKVSSYDVDLRDGSSIATVTIWVKGLYIDYIPVGVLTLLIISIAVVVIDKIKNRTKGDRSRPTSAPIPNNEYKRP